MKFQFSPVPIAAGVCKSDWDSWAWQMRNSARGLKDFENSLQLTEQEVAGFGIGAFRVRTTPYYLALGSQSEAIRRLQVPHIQENGDHAVQQMLDPLSERKNSPVPRLIHRYPDRVLLLVTDTCSVYCRYCTRKHFTATDQSLISEQDLAQALNYIRLRPGIREVILSGGDPLVLSEASLVRVLKLIREISHIEIVRIGSRMPVVCPMRITHDLIQALKDFHPIYIMTHFNHPDELTQEAAEAVLRFVENGFPVFNQMVLLNGINNHPAVVQALSRRLVYLRVKPYYMFQCDPSQGTDHLRTSIEDSEQIQRELWGNLSGLAMPNLSLDIPNGGGKVGLVPEFETARSECGRNYRGWDGVEAEYQNPRTVSQPPDIERYKAEWELLKSAKQPANVSAPSEVRRALAEHT